MGFEPGHQIIDLDKAFNKSFACDGDVESMVGGGALKRLTGISNAEDVEDQSIWDNMSRLLAVGLNNIIVLWSPDTIVLGGGLVIHDHMVSRRVGPISLLERKDHPGQEGFMR